MFLYFRDKNKALFCDGRKRIEDSTLVALTLHDCGVSGGGEGNDGERGDELYVGEVDGCV